MSVSTERVPRLLALIPYLLNHPGIPVAEAAQDFQITPQQLRKDLELLWMCGLPGYGPGDLIDLSFDADTVTVTYDAGINRPLRMTTAEATSLLVGLRALSQSPGIVDPAPVERALRKIEQAVGNATASQVVVELTDETPRVGRWRDSLRDALRDGKAVRIRYYTASRDHLSERVIDPMRLAVEGGRSYVEAWCRTAGAVRIFRIDRIDALTVLDEQAQLPAGVRNTDLSAGMYPSRPDQQVAVLHLAQPVRWIAEYYPMDEAVELGDGALRVRMRYTDAAWLVRFVLGLGAHATVEEPPSIAQCIRQRAYDALALSDHLHDTYRP
jgi:proteasome accessory factor C